MKFKIGDTLKLVFPRGIKGAKLGDPAQVVDGEKTFPKLYKEFRIKVSKEIFGQFIWVKWTAPAPYKPEIDGAYLVDRFEKE